MRKITLVAFLFLLFVTGCSKDENLVSFHTPTKEEANISTLFSGLSNSFNLDERNIKKFDYESVDVVAQAYLDKRLVSEKVLSSISIAEIEKKNTIFTAVQKIDNNFNFFLMTNSYSMINESISLDPKKEYRDNIMVNNGNYIVSGKDEVLITIYSYDVPADNDDLSIDALFDKSNDFVVLKLKFNK